MSTRFRSSSSAWQSSLATTLRFRGPPAAAKASAKASPAAHFGQNIAPPPQILLDQQGAARKQQPHGLGLIPGPEQKLCLG